MPDIDWKKFTVKGHFLPSYIKTTEVPLSKVQPIKMGNYDC